MTEMTPPDDGLINCARNTTRRIEQFSYGGAAYWVKRPETLKPRMRMQKGSPEAAFERERDALRKLGPMGAPVPRLMVDLPGLIVVEDCGRDLLFHRRFKKDDALCDKFHDAGLALARLHGMDHTHGRPALRDLCWRDGRVTVIDLERSHPSLDHPRGRARDVVLLFINGLMAMQGPCAELDALRDGYRAGDSANTWDDALRWSRNLTWMALLTRPLHLLSLPIREVRTLPVARDYFREQRRLRRAE
ncbi:MAG: hypothetical protein GKR99_19100 [Rhodobacteraceae bacterium]|nr:hypothetical protein [Paracoccaceae bacterium]